MTNMTNLTVRAATPGDREALARLNLEVQQLHVSNRPDDFKPASVAELALWFAEVMNDSAATVWLAEHDGAAVGFLLVRVRQVPENLFCKARLWWELDSLSVAADHRRQGVCRALFERVLSEARAQEISDLELQTWAFNRDAQEAFSRLGFVPKRVRYELRVGSLHEPD
jgi:GNAT superfamily N-acetyltransferase